MWMIIFFAASSALAGVSGSRAIYDTIKTCWLTFESRWQISLLTSLVRYITPTRFCNLASGRPVFLLAYRSKSLLNDQSRLADLCHAGPRHVGASTISMQVARMRYGINSKKLSGKIWQMIRALQLEAHYSKSQLLEAYLNLAPYGNNVEGAGAASLIYFNKYSTGTQLYLKHLTLVVIPAKSN